MTKKLTEKKKSEIMLSDAYVTITSREIAEMTDKRHDNVLADIERIASNIGFTESNQPLHVRVGRKDNVTDIFYRHYYQVNGKGKKYPMYVLGQFMADMVITSYSDEYRAVLLRELYDRRENSRLWNNHRENLRHEHWQLIAHISRLSQPNAAGEAQRDSEGKRLVMRYSTELDMLNRAVLGVSAKQFKELHQVKEVRDALTDEQVYILDLIHKHNLSLLSMNMGYYTRKATLQLHVAILSTRLNKYLV